MKVSIFHEFVYPYSKGGGEVQRYQVAKNLALLGNSVTLVGFKYPNVKNSEIIDGFRIDRVGLLAIDNVESHFRRLIDSVGMFFYALAKDFDIMMTNPYLSMISTLPVAKLRGKKVAVTWDDIFGSDAFINHKGKVMGTFGSLLERICLWMSRYADVVFTVSNSTRRKLMAGGVKPERIEIMFNGIDPNDYRNKNPVRKKKQIVYIGRHVFYKNVDHLIKAFAPSAKKDKDLKLIILGNGNLTDQYKQLAKDLGIEKNVDFLGFVYNEDKIRILKESLFLVLPSSYEGFGLVLIEANACHTPYIAYNVPAVEEVTEITKGGILVEHGNIEELSLAMKDLLKNNKKRDSLASDGSRNVLKHFTWKSVAETVNKKISSLA